MSRLRRFSQLGGQPLCILMNDVALKPKMCRMSAALTQVARKCTMEKMSM